ncbi:hypothetical protein JOF55_003707 [Haloactinomyces albus]|uniref:Uncharacterized protein n=1 Tax=Haloactinomyces albus TaxID=1352928 RepID=A0AAE3ZGL3_9ACTN|nr:hypothetical protein [Haloactinomyces albus]
MLNGQMDVRAKLDEWARRLAAVLLDDAAERVE